MIEPLARNPNASDKVCDKGILCGASLASAADAFTSTLVTSKIAGFICDAMKRRQIKRYNLN